MKLAKSVSRLIAVSTLAVAPTVVAGSTSQAATHIIRIGQIFRNGPYAARVNGFKCGIGYVGNTSLGKEATGQFCRVSFTFENVTKSPQFAPGYYLAKDTRGFTYADDQIANIYGNGIAAFSTLQFNPYYGEKFSAYFDVPKNDSLRYFLFSFEYGYPPSVVRL